jgi:putative membrane protein
MKTLVKILVTAIAVIIISKLMPSIHVVNYTSAVWVAAVLALLNTFLRPILVLLTLPATIFSMGFFIFVINAGIVLLASNMVAGFFVDGFMSALLFSLLLWGVRTLLFSLLLEDDQTPRNRIS